MLLSFVKGTSISICTVLVLKMKIISNLDENYQYRALRHFNPRYVTTHDLSHAAGPMSALYREGGVEVSQSIFYNQFGLSKTSD